MTTTVGLFAIRSQTNENSINNDSSIPTINTKESISTKEKSEEESLFEELGLVGKLKFEAFQIALNGLENLNFNNKEIISVIDFTLPSTEKRMFVLDLKNKKVLFETIVSHGRNSGEKYAKEFSNRHGSFQSSLGFYTTENTYQGGNGYSLVLNGLEKGINDQAKPRAVVIHGADYCSTDVIKSTGRLGRSYGCPALPRQLTGPIINTIKNGTMLFIYAEDKTYLASSKIINQSKSMIAQSDEIDNENNTHGVLN